MHALAILAEEGSALSIDASAVVIFGTALVLIWILDLMLFRPINQVLDERARRTQGFVSEAKAMLAESDRKLTRYEAALRQARGEIYTLLELRRKEALDERSRKLEGAKKEVAARIAEARAEIEDQLAGAKSDLALETRAIAHRIAGSLVGRNIEEVEGIS